MIGTLFWKRLRVDAQIWRLIEHVYRRYLKDYVRDLGIPLTDFSGAECADALCLDRSLVVRVAPTNDPRWSMDGPQDVMKHRHNIITLEDLPETTSRHLIMVI